MIDGLLLAPALLLWRGGVCRGGDAFRKFWGVDAP